MKNISQMISVPALFFLSVTISLVAFFQLWRAILLAFLWDATTGIPIATVAEAFLVGLRFDFAIACYIMAPLTLIGMFPGIDIVRRKFTRKFIVVTLVTISAALFFGHLADIEFFKMFNSRLNGTALIWQDTPGFMLSMMWETYPVIWYMLLWLTVVVLFVWIIKRLMGIVANCYGPSPIITDLIWMIVLLAIMLVGARGRLKEKSPLRWGVAYFSEYNFTNQLALNPIYTFLYDAAYSSGSRADMTTTIEKISNPNAESIVQDWLGLIPDASGRLHAKVSFDPPSEDPPNVILVIMESFGSTRIGALENKYEYDLSPRFDSLANKGTLFTNFYSNGMHTYTGIFCSLYGYPHLIGKLIMKQMTGQAYFHGLPQILSSQGYETYFFTTHDPHFDNMQGFLKANGVKHVIGLDDYDQRDKLSTLGVPDHVMFEKTIDILREKSNERFFATCLTSSNHGPWMIPDVAFDHIPESEPLADQLNAFKYSDWALGKFVRELEADSAFDNTIVVVTADNGALYEPKLDLDLTQFAIPLLIYPIGVDSINESSARRIDLLGSQLDIVATVMGQLRLDYTNYTFGHDLLDSKTTDSSLINDDPPQSINRSVTVSEWYTLGMITENYYFIDRLRGTASLYSLYDLHNGRTIDLADSLKTVAEGYRRLSRALFETAFRNMKRPIRPDSEPTEISSAGVPNEQ